MHVTAMTAIHQHLSYIIYNHNRAHAEETRYCHILHEIRCRECTTLSANSTDEQNKAWGYTHYRLNMLRTQQSNKHLTLSHDSQHVNGTYVVYHLHSTAGILLSRNIQQKR